ncbi:MAG: acyltransferase [Rhodoferax sp.]|uniref:DapH/DapD/GlmU-related protein n=1 Tax=Rhodoferax sp. TaxID=50421 RepID=UPI001835F3D7|nr:DapH/DapD/GlmU-related protein [Rhodoferax sp.]NMM13774.1 acyltransferase [Rhodoferax sp.]
MYFKKHISTISSVISNEKPRVALFRIISFIFYILEGKFAAFCIGWKNSYLGKGSRVIGTRFIVLTESVSIGRHAWIEVIVNPFDSKVYPVISIGRGFYASEHLHISAINRIEIGDDCLFGSGVYISDHNHGSYKGDVQSHPCEPPVLRRLSSHGPVRIGCNVWIGDNVAIIGSVQIGSGVIIGANSIVTSDVPNNVIIGGIPAKIIKRFNFLNKKWESCPKN